HWEMSRVNDSAAAPRSIDLSSKTTKWPAQSSYGRFRCQSALHRAGPQAKRERIIVSFRASLKRLKSAAVFLKWSNEVPSDASHNSSHEIVCTRIAKPICRRHCWPQ